MNRRQYLRSACGVALAVASAGCSQDGGTGEMTETAVINVRDQFGAEGGVTEAEQPPEIPPDITETDAPEISISATDFNRPDENRFVVEGALTNESDRAFGHVELETQLYDVNEDTDEFFDTDVQQEEFEYLAADQTWTFTHSFRHSRIGTVDYFVATATADFAESSPE